MVLQRTIRHQWNGLDLASEFFYPAKSPPAASVIVFPEALGLGAHALAVGRLLAQSGFAALAADPYGDAKLFATMAEVMPIVRALRGDPDLVRRKAQHFMDVLLAQPGTHPSRLAAIGYCFGGTMALELARSGADLGLVAGFHCGLTQTAPTRAEIKSKIALFIGADDPSISATDRAAFEDEMRASNVKWWRMYLYGNTVHSFTNPRAADLGQPDLLRYDAEADRHSWMELLNLLRQTF